MGNNLNVDNSLINSLNSSVMNDAWLESIAGEKKTVANNELKKVFSQISSNNVSESEKKALEKRAKKLVEDMESYQKDMKKLEKEITANQEKIDAYAAEMQDLIATAEGRAAKLEDEQKSLIQDSINDAFALYEQGKLGKDAIGAEIVAKIKAGAANLTVSSKIDDILEKIDSKQGLLSDIAGKAADSLDKRNTLNRKYTTASSAYNLLNKTIGQMDKFSTSYTNSDTNSAKPIYSLEKTAVAAKILANDSYNVEATNTAFVEGSTAKAPKTSMTQVSATYSKYFSTTSQVAKGKDSYNAAYNPAIVNLGKAINDGMLSDLAASGSSMNDICSFIATNFKAANVTFDTNANKISIPYGHDATSRDVFAKLKNFVDTGETSSIYTKNTWDENAGNTISSNAQIKALSQNYSTILDTLNKNGFTFKESMYFLFDSTNGIFKDSGISYNLGDQQLSISLAGDAETAKLFNNVASKIQSEYKYQAYNENTTHVPTTTKVEVDNGTKTTPTPTPTVKRTDPMSFVMNNTEYTFVVDRNADGNFSSASEFVGATGNWLEDLKALDKEDENGVKDGILKGEELENLKLLASKYNETNSAKSSTTKINYSILSAKDLGIEEINLNDLEQQVGNSTGKYDANGSEVYTDSFTFKMNGKDVTATRKDDTSDYMKAVYSASYGKKMEVGLDEETIDEVLKEIPNSATDFNYGQTVAGLQMIKNADKISAEVSAMFQQVLNRIEAEKSQEVNRAITKAASYSSRAGWNATRSQIQNFADAAGVQVDMEQARGIYNTDGSLDAKQIFDKVVQDANDAKANAKQAEVEDEAWKSIVMCLKNGIKITHSKALELLTSGQAKTAQDIVDILKEPEVEEE